jgi:hypothetical protein
MAGMKIKAGDTVEVITGKDAGRRGRVLEAIPRAATSRRSTRGRGPSAARAAPR